MGSPANTDEFLAHFGVKGMKWGRRNHKPSSSVRNVLHPHKTIPKNVVHPNQLQPISKDAKNAASYKKVATTKGTQALSNKQLQDLVNRQNLEQQYARLNPAPVSAGAKIWKQLQPVVGAAAQSQWSAHQPQIAKQQVTDLVPYSKPTMSQLVGKVALATGKQVLSDPKTLSIGLGIATALLSR